MIESISFMVLVMKKFFKIFFINILIFIILVECSGLFIEKHINDDWILEFQNNVIRPLNYNYGGVDISSYNTEPESVIRLPLNDSNFKNFCGEYRDEFIPEGWEEGGYNPIVTLGCSYMYGHGLKREQTFTYLLSELTKRPVYNYASCGGTIFSSLNRLMTDDFQKQRVKNADYVIYMYMHDHMNRYMDLQYIGKYYNELFKLNPAEKILSKVFLFKMILTGFKLREMTKDYPNSDYAQKILKSLMLIAYKQIKTVAPHAKFIIIVYDEKIAETYPQAQIMFDMDILNSSLWRELNNQTDITVIHTKDITGFDFDKNYKLKEDIADWHPNEKVWELFTPLFAENYIK